MRKKLMDFIPTIDVDKSYDPLPAIELLPEWYKNTPSTFISEEKMLRNSHNNRRTVKKCLPVFDAMTAGYIIRTWKEVMVTNQDGGPFYYWRNPDPIGFHPVEQADQHPKSNGFPFPKWNNPWGIRTPPGWSCLFIPPLHRPNDIFTILPGIVDTDTYNSPVNFTFTLNVPMWEGSIPPGTPMVQVIPFKREAWGYKVHEDDSEGIAKRSSTKWATRFFDSYKKGFWRRKEWRDHA